MLRQGFFPCFRQFENRAVSRAHEERAIRARLKRGRDDVLDVGALRIDLVDVKNGRSAIVRLADLKSRHALDESAAGWDLTEIYGGQIFAIKNQLRIKKQLRIIGGVFLPD